MQSRGGVGGCVGAPATVRKFQSTEGMKPLQLLAASLLIYAACITSKCPCERINSCHKPHFFLSVGAAVAIIWYDNYGR